MESGTDRCGDLQRWRPGNCASPHDLLERMQIIFASRSYLHAHAASPVVVRLLGCRPNCIHSWRDRRPIASESSSKVSLHEDCNPENRCSRAGSRSTGSSELSIRLRVGTEHNTVLAVGCLNGPFMRSRGAMALSQGTLATARKHARNRLAVAKSQLHSLTPDQNLELRSGRRKRCSLFFAPSASRR
jgi:hypothetical protein